MALTDRGVASKEAGDRDRATQDFDEAAQVAGSVAEDDEIYDDSQDSSLPASRTSEGNS